MTLDQLLKIMPYAGPRAAIYLPHLNATFAEFDINTPARQAAFLAQLAHETGQLACVTENMHYGVNALMRVWPKRFPNVIEAVKYANQPEKLANYVYANRMGNGGPETGDGARFIGSGGFQITGKDNHQKCADHFGISINAIGDWLRTPEGAMRSAGWFWTRANCNKMADIADFDAISDAINIGHDTAAVGDAIGYKDRFAFFTVANKVLA